MVQIICDICGKPIPAGKLYVDSKVKQKRSGKWCDIDVCKSCAHMLLWATEISAPNVPILLNMETMKKIQEKENNNDPADL